MRGVAELRGSGKKRDWHDVGPTCQLLLKSPRAPKPPWALGRGGGAREGVPPGGAHRFLCFSPNAKFAVFRPLKAKRDRGSRVTHLTADFTSCLGCGETHCDMNGGRTDCSNL